MSLNFLIGIYFSKFCSFEFFWHTLQTLLFQFLNQLVCFDVWVACKMVRRISVSEFYRKKNSEKAFFALFRFLSGFVSAPVSLSMERKTFSVWCRILSIGIKVPIENLFDTWPLVLTTLWILCKPLFRGSSLWSSVSLVLLPPGMHLSWLWVLFSLCPTGLHFFLVFVE